MTEKRYFLTPNGKTGFRPSVAVFPQESILITPEQHGDVLAAKADGKETTVIGGELVIRERAPSPEHTWENGEWVAPEPEPEEPEPIDPLEQTLTKRQVNAALIIGGQIEDPDVAVEAAIGQIEDAQQRALARNDWRNAPYYERNHDLFNDPDLLAAMNMTTEQVDQLWELGWTLPA